MTDPDAAAAGRLSLAGRSVPRMGYGTMRLTGPGIFGPPADRAEAVRVLRRAVELGVRLIDTSWYYGPYVADEILAEALRPYPDDLVIVTKLGGARRDDGSWYSDFSREALQAGCDHDLRLLGLDSIPITHFRWMDNGRDDFDEALDAFLELRDAGKIQHVGVSNVDEAQLDRVLARTEVVTVSNAYSVVDRTHEGLVRRCEQAGIAFLPFFPLGASPMADGAGVDRAGAVRDVAARLGVSVTQLALAWLLARSPVMVPIPGTSSVAHLEENVAAAGLELSPDVLAELAG